MELQIGVCIPNLCDPDIVLNMTDQLIGFNIPLKSTPGSCQTHEKEKITAVAMISM